MGYPRKNIVIGLAAYLGLIISIEITHKNISSVATNFAAPPASSTSSASILSTLARLELHLDPGSCFTRGGELAKPETQ